MEINLVKQEEDSGCVPACLATVLGLSYETVSADFQNDFTKKGVSEKFIIEYLGDQGCSLIRKSVECYTHKDFARKELLTPFAPIHIVCLEHNIDMDDTHVVVMDADGNLHDPGGLADEDLRKSYKFRSVYGIYTTYPVATEVSAPTSS